MIISHSSVLVKERKNNSELDRNGGSYLITIYPLTTPTGAIISNTLISKSPRVTALYCQTAVMINPATKMMISEAL